MDIEKQFGTALKKWRGKLNLSQEALSKRAGLHRTYVCDVERGARNVSLKNVQKLANALALPLQTLLADLSGKATTVPMAADEQVDILIVEDNENDIELTLHAFGTWGFSNRIFVVRDGLAALEFLFGTGAFAHRRATDQPQVILLDINLPKIGGLEVLRRIKADPRTGSIPVIILSSSLDSRDMTECKRLGVENYILKPVGFQSFSEVSLRLNLQWAMLRSVVAPT